MPLENDAPDTELDNPDIQDYVPDNTESGKTPADGETSVEDQARALGWVPEDEYTGRGRWVDAEKFIDDRRNSVTKKTLDRQAQEIAELKKQVAGMGTAHQRIFDLQVKKLKEEHEQQLAFLKLQKREALRAGEHEQAADIDDQIDKLRENGPELPEVPESTPANKPAGQQDWRQNKILVEWAERHPWFEKDEDMSAYAGGIGQKIRAENPTMPFTELLEEVAGRVRKAFPHKFTTRRTSPVEETTPGATSGAAARGTYASLPADAKRMCDETVSEGHVTQKQWVELYYGYDDRRKR